MLEYPLRADVALVKAHVADELGNLVYRKTARNFGPVMATAARTTIVQVSQVVPVGGLDPEHVVTPCIYVDRVVRVPVDVRAGGARERALGGPRQGRAGRAGRRATSRRAPSSTSGSACRPR